MVETMTHDEKTSILPEKLVEISQTMARVGGWVADLTTGRVVWGDQTNKLLGLPVASSVTISKATKFFGKKWRPRIRALFTASIRHGTSFDNEFQLLSYTGRVIWVRIIGEAVQADSGKVIRIHGAVQDISSLKFTEEAAYRVSVQLHATLESITDAFLMVDRDWNFTYLNSEAEHLLNCSRGEVLGSNIWVRFPEAVGGPCHRQYCRAVRENCTVAFEEYYPLLDLWTEIRAYPSDEGLAIFFIDIGQRKATEERIRQLAFYDVLTGLPNRRLLMDRLDHAVQLSQRTHSFGALLFIDLDDFKAVNDTSGHDKGDMLLQLAADRLKNILRADDTIARVGGDEFIVLLEKMGQTEETLFARVKTITEKILADFRRPFLITGIEHYTTASIGATIFNGKVVTSADALKQADLAMYNAKAAGRNRTSFFDRHIADRMQIQISLKAELLQALEQEQFVLHYQPQVDMGGHVKGVEALVRWNHPQRGLVFPDDFITLAETNGLILPLGQWVLTAACKQLTQWASTVETNELSIAVNVSAHQLRRPNFVEQILRAVSETGANPQRLELELTESLLIEDVEGTISKMNRLKECGIGFSLDDFGTGYSSLSYLHRLPLNQLKIDRSFIQSAVSEEHGATIARAIVALAKSLNLTVLAEGVETQDQYAFVSQEGCNAYQGYFFSKPVPAADIVSLIKRVH